MRALRGRSRKTAAALNAPTPPDGRAHEKVHRRARARLVKCLRFAAGARAACYERFLPRTGAGRGYRRLSWHPMSADASLPAARHNPCKDAAARGERVSDGALLVFQVQSHEQLGATCTPICSG